MSSCKEKSLVKRVVAAENAMRNILQRMWFDGFNHKRNPNHTRSTAESIFRHNEIGIVKYKDPQIVKWFDTIMRDVYTGERLYFAFDKMKTHWDWDVTDILYLTLELDDMVDLDRIMKTPIGTMLNAQIIDDKSIKLIFEEPDTFDNVRTIGQFNDTRKDGKFVHQAAIDIVNRYMPHTEEKVSDVAVIEVKNMIFDLLNAISSEKQKELKELMKQHSELVSQRDKLNTSIDELAIGISIINDQIKSQRNEILKSVSNFEIV